MLKNYTFLDILKLLSTICYIGIINNNISLKDRRNKLIDFSQIEFSKSNVFIS